MGPAALAQRLRRPQTQSTNNALDNYETVNIYNFTRKDGRDEETSA